MPAGVRGEPGVEKIRHYRNADGKLLVFLTRSLRARASEAIDFFLELTDNQRQCVLIYQLDAVGVLAKGEHRHRVPGSLACPRGCAGSLGLRK